MTNLTALTDLLLRTWIDTEARLRTLLRAWHAQEQGQGMVEYSLILPLVSVIAIALLVLLGSKVTALFSSSYTQISLVLS